jgi:hypothetical protein
MTRSRSESLIPCRYFQPNSLKQPPKPSQVCFWLLSSMVTVAVPVDAVRVPGVQVVPVPDTQLPLFEMYTAGAPESVDPPVDAPPAAEVPPEPVVPPVADPPPEPPPVPVLPPVAPPESPLVPPESPALLPVPVPVVPPVLPPVPVPVPVPVVPPVLPPVPVEPPELLDEPPLDDPPGLLDEPPELLDEPPELLDEPPLELPDEPPLDLLDELPLDPPCDELELPPELQAATRNARQTLVFRICGLFIAQPRWKSACGLARSHRLNWPLRAFPTFFSTISRASYPLPESASLTIA